MIHFDKFFGEARERLGDDYLAALERAGIPNGTTSFSKIPVSRLNTLCNELFVTFDSIATGNVDISTLKDHLRGGSQIPAKYSSNVPYSSRFTSMYMLNYLRSVLGNEPVKYLCQHFQLKEDQFTNTSEKNNILLPHDICAYVQKYFGEDMLIAMGESSIDLFKKSAGGKELMSEREIKPFFEKLIFDILPIHIEKNFFWNIDRAGLNFIQLSGKLNGDVEDSLNLSPDGVESLEILRKGFLKALPRLIGIQDVKVERIKSVSAGDLHDIYLLHYGQPDKAFPQFH